MKNLCKRLISTMLMLALVLSLIPVIRTEAKTWNTNQQNIADRANYFFDTTWVCQKTVNGWRDQYTFYEGETYHLPYGQPVNSGEFIGYGVTLEDFLISAADGDSVYYSVQSEYRGWTSVYYATDCAAFVAMCWGTVRQDCSTIPYYSTYLGNPTEENIHDILALGDALDSTSVGHVVLVTDMIYDDNGTLTTIEITEQTPPQLKRTYFTPEELAAKYGDEFGIYRYYGAVPAAPVRGYEADCTAYASHCTIEITGDTVAMSLPCTAQVNDESTFVAEIAAGESYTAIKLYENTAGELWYKLKMDNDEDAYIPVANARYVDQILTDITLTNADTPVAHIQGEKFSVTGNISSRYNRLNKASVYIYKGFGKDGTRVTGGSDTVSSNAYTLVNSDIDFATAFNAAGLGQNTYVISAEYVNYYVDDAGNLKSNSATLDLLTHYFMVVESETNQNTCSHNYSTTIQEGTSCTEDDLLIHSCADCGKVYTETRAAAGHAYGQWKTTQNATCTEAGSKNRSCDTCGNVETEVIPATGHDYHSQTIEGNCQTHEGVRYTCGNCGDEYETYAEEMYTDWLETAPEGIAQNLIQTKTQYRYADLETITSSQPELDGYIQMGSTWAEEGTSGTVEYVKEWPDGFSRTHSLYTQYNNTPMTASVGETTKTVLKSDGVTGYLYYHWCSNSSIYSTPAEAGNYNIFHAFYSTVDPDTHDRYDPSDNSYLFQNECCSNSDWFFVTQVRTQNYMTYDKVYSHGVWGAWSDWSDTACEETETRKVETQTLYRYVDAPLGDHDWVNGVCSVCGETTETPEIPEIPAEPTVPVLSVKGFTLSLEDEVYVNFYFSAENGEGLTETGMLVFNKQPTRVEFFRADRMYKNALYNEETGQYMSKTDGIAAKNLGDTCYYAAYAILPNGNYIYSDLHEYSPKKYAMSRIEKSTDENLKALCVAMLNYGAEAQMYLGYNTDTLMNADLTAEQLSLVTEYSKDLFLGAVAADSSKIGTFAKTDPGFSTCGVSLSLDGAFALNYYFTPNAAVSGDITFYYWTADAYAAAGTLTAENASGFVTMTDAGNGSYWANIPGIAAKELDDTFYAAGVYTGEDGICSTGVIAYSMSKFCMNKAAGTTNVSSLAAALAVYGHHAEVYFS